MELEARKKQQREEEKRKAEEAAAKANHEQTIEGRNQSAGDFVENSQSVGGDTDPSISGVVNGNPLSKDLEGNQNSTSKSGSENEEGSDHFNAVNKKSLEKVLLYVS
jgi:YidC/Oxa1 family membrane protein insertase